jgi:hypothetical protein
MLEDAREGAHKSCVFLSSSTLSIHSSSSFSSFCFIDFRAIDRLASSSFLVRPQKVSLFHQQLITFPMCCADVLYIERGFVFFFFFSLRDIS